MPKPGRPRSSGSVVLRFTITSAATIGVLLGVVFLAAMANEFFLAYVRLHWRWAHVLMGLSSSAGRSGPSSIRSAPSGPALLTIWVGAFAIFRGITEIVTAFELKSLQHR